MYNIKAFQNINFSSNHKISLQYIILPLGISFITFQKIAFLADCHQKKVKRPNFLDYTLFVSFFPQLIAGPIVHHAEIIPQFKSLKAKIINYKNIALGIFLCSIGLFKKVVIADKLALYNFQGFEDPECLFGIEAWLTSLAYSFQIYFDFSGYSDMAIGAALLFNIKLPYNFNSPYKAVNIQDFWGRWHITLSRFLKDYIYIPLGGNRRGKARTYINLMLVFLISGLWHGASWTFIFWGMLQGLAVCINRLWNKLGYKMNKYCAILTTFLFVNFSWVFFRANNFENAVLIIKKMLFLDGADNSKINYELLNKAQEAIKLNGYEFMSLFFIIISIVYLRKVIFSDAKENSRRFRTNKKYLYLLAVIFFWSFYNIYQASTFIYFNF